MPLIQTADLTSRLSPDALLNKQIYCGLDSCVALEVNEEIDKIHGEPPAIYQFECALQAPYLEIMERGWKVDLTSRYHAVEELNKRIGLLEHKLNLYAQAWWDKGLNSRSYPQLKELFFSKMYIPEIWVSRKGERKISLARDVLERIAEEYIHARPLVYCILGVRELAKQREVLEQEVDYDNRWRTSYNITGTETGRPSSSRSAYGTGGNAQNVDPRLRYAFVADDGKKLGQIDLEQVEARDVGWLCGVLFGDWSYLDSCESGDLHTNNTRLTWPHLQWTGDKNRDKEMASTLLAYRNFSYRDLMKRGGHLTNYMGTAWTAANALKVPIGVMEDFQPRYLGAFPCIPRYWQWVAEQLQTKHVLVTPFGRQRHFFSRPDDPHTIREGVAYLPQSTTADRMNLGLYRIWEKEPRVELLGNGFDSVVFQYSEGLNEDDLMQRLLELIRVEFVAPSGRRYVVPGEVKIGWNWGNEVTQRDIEKARLRGDTRLPKLNLEGLRKWQLGVKDPRKRAYGLDRGSAK